MLSDKIVIVDDDIKVAKALKLVFKEYEILDFQDPQKAITFLSRPSEINLVLIDVYMGEMNGLDVLQEIKKVNKNVAVIIMTAFGSKDIAVEALRGKADEFVEKPFDIGELREKIRIILREKSYLQELGAKNHVERIKKFVERNPENVSLEHVSREICLSPKYVSRLFRNKNVNGFRDYKIEVKINKAKSLLEKSSYTVSQIADNLGYQNPESFMRIFKKVTKCTPTQYRKKFRTQKQKSGREF